VRLLYFCVICVLFVFLQYFETLVETLVGSFGCKTVSHITYTVLVETLNHAQSINPQYQMQTQTMQPTFSVIFT